MRPYGFSVSAQSYRGIGAVRPASSRVADALARSTYYAWIMAGVDACGDARRMGLIQPHRRIASMNRDRIEGTRKHSKDHRKQKASRPIADDREGGRPHMGAKSQKTFGIRKDEAERQIRELQSRYG